MSNIKPKALVRFRRSLGQQDVDTTLWQAAVTVRNMQKDGIRNKFCNWPDYVPLYPDEDKPMYIVPTAQQITDAMTVVLEWLPWVEHHPAMGLKYARVLWARANGNQWDDIARFVGRKSRSTPNKWYDEAITAIYYALRAAENKPVPHIVNRKLEHEGK